MYRRSLRPGRVSSSIYARVRWFYHKVLLRPFQPSNILKSSREDHQTMVVLPCINSSSILERPRVSLSLSLLADGQFSLSLALYLVLWYFVSQRNKLEGVVRENKRQVPAIARKLLLCALLLNSAEKLLLLFLLLLTPAHSNPHTAHSTVFPFVYCFYNERGESAGRRKQVGESLMEIYAFILSHKTFRVLLPL